MSKSKSKSNAKRIVARVTGKVLNLARLHERMQEAYRACASQFDGVVSEAAYAKLISAEVTCDMATVPTKAMTVKGSKYERTHRKLTGAVEMSNGQFAATIRFDALISLETMWNAMHSACLKIVGTEMHKKAGQLRHNATQDDVVLMSKWAGFEWGHVPGGNAKEWLPTAKERATRKSQLANLCSELKWPSLPEINAVRGSLQRDAVASGTQTIAIHCGCKKCNKARALLAQKKKVPFRPTIMRMHLAGVDPECDGVQANFESIEVERDGRKIVSVTMTPARGQAWVLGGIKLSKQEVALAVSKASASKAEDTLRAFMEAQVAAEPNKVKRAKLKKAQKAALESL
jgi:hypothetical protein